MELSAWRERFEKVADLFGRHADARIADGEAETCFAPFVALLRDGNKDVAGLCELDGRCLRGSAGSGKAGARHLPVPVGRPG